MSTKIKVGVLFGGKSVEHEVSLQSARNVIDAMDKEKYEPVLIGIAKDGQWYLQNAAQSLLNQHDLNLIALNPSVNKVALVPQAQSSQLLNLDQTTKVTPIDVYFPVLHGSYGEDGTMQVLLKLAGVPFVGCGVMASAAGMDKDVTKRLWRDAGLPIADYVALSKFARHRPSPQQLVTRLGLPLFIKPANLGSSVGVHKAKSEEEIAAALEDAFHYDTKVIVEEFIQGREIECSVLGNDNPLASIPGEVLPQHEFYSYEAKYLDEKGAALEIPAKLPPEMVQTIQETAINAFVAIGGQGMARVDFFLRLDNTIVLNEINTIPGFTRISMYPKLWEASGIPYRELIDRLISLALERHTQESQLKTSI